MIEVFFRTVGRTVQRREMAERCRGWWKKQDVKYREITMPLLGCALEEFNLKSRQYAESEAKGDIYILTDDDMLPVRSQITNPLVDYPQFGIISAWPDRAQINYWTPNDYAVFDDNVVLEHVSVGGLRWIRKGIEAWPEQTGEGYDREHCEQFRKQGLRVGYTRKFHAIHLGEHFTELWTDVYRKRQPILCTE